MDNIFSNLPNNLIMKIIKMNTDEEIKSYKNMFNKCMYELKYEYNVKEDWEPDYDYDSDGSYHSSSDEDELN